MQQDQLSPFSNMGQTSVLFTLIRQHDGITRQQLSRLLSIPPTTLNRNLERLLKAGLIDESGLADSSGGRRPNLYTKTNKPLYFLGLDLSGACRKAVVVDLNLSVIGSATYAGLTELMQQNDSADQITAFCNMLLSELAISGSQIHGIGIALVLPTQNEHEDSDQTDPEQAANYFDQLRQSLENTYQCAIQMLRGEDAALYAGLWLDRKLSGSTMLYFSAGLSMRTGMVLQGQFHQTDLATDNIDDLLVPYGSKRTLTEINKVSTRSALLRQFQDTKQTSKLSWQDFCKACKQGKRKSIQVLDMAARATAVAIWNALTLIDARYLLLGGSVIYDIPSYQTMLVDQIHKIMKNSERQPVILSNPYGEDIVAVGAAARMLEHVNFLMQ